MNEMEITEGQLLSQDFGLSAPVSESKKPPEILAAEIRSIKAQTGAYLLNSAIEVGRRLTDSKAQLPHGRWGEFLKQEVDYSPSQAQNLMRIFREYGEEQQSLFGGRAKSQTFGNLTFSKALSLLAIPDEEDRERFVLENDVEHMSVRELNAALKARDEAEEAARKLNGEVDELNERLADQHRDYEAKLASIYADANQARTEAETVRVALEKQKDKAQRLQDALSEANTAAQAAEEEHAGLLRELEELRNRPAEADPAAVDAARQAAIAEMTEKVDKANDAKKKAEEKRKAAEKSLEAAQKALAELKAKEPEVRELTQEEKDALTADAVEKVKVEAAKQIRGMEKKLALADPNVAEFQVRFNSWLEDHQKMMEVLGRIAQTDEERADRFQQAVQAAIAQMQTHEQ